MSKLTLAQLQQAEHCIAEQFRLAQPRLAAAFGNIAETLKADKTPVTELDVQLEHEFRDALLKFDSGIGIVGEELGEQGSKDTFWLLDPIDGTESFIRGIPAARNMATLIDNGQPVLTVVYKFMADRMYTAIQGQGAFCNGQPLTVSQRPIERSWIELAAPLSNPELFPVIQGVRKLINGYRVTGDFCLVMDGAVDGLLQLKVGGGDWDYAPRALLMQEAGAKVTNIGVDTYDYRNHDVLVANPAIFDRLMQAIVDAN